MNFNPSCNMNAITNVRQRQPMQHLLLLPPPLAKPRFASFNSRVFHFRLFTPLFDIHIPCIAPALVSCIGAHAANASSCDTSISDSSSHHISSHHRHHSLFLSLSVSLINRSHHTIPNVDHAFIQINISPSCSISYEIAGLDIHPRRCIACWCWGVEAASATLPIYRLVGVVTLSTCEWARLIRSETSARLWLGHMSGSGWGTAAADRSYDCYGHFGFFFLFLASLK